MCVFIYTWIYVVLCGYLQFPKKGKNTQKRTLHAEVACPKCLRCSKQTLGKARICHVEDGPQTQQPHIQSHCRKKTLKTKRFFETKST